MGLKLGNNPVFLNPLKGKQLKLGDGNRRPPSSSALGVFVAAKGRKHERVRGCCRMILERVNDDTGTAALQQPKVGSMGLILDLSENLKQCVVEICTRGP